MALLKINFVEMLAEIQAYVNFGDPTYGCHQRPATESYLGHVNTPINKDGDTFGFTAQKETASIEEAYEAAAREAVHSLLVFHGIKFHDVTYDIIERTAAYSNDEIWKTILGNRQNHQVVSAAFKLSNEITQLRAKVADLEREKNEALNREAENKTRQLLLINDLKASLLAAEEEVRGLKEMIKCIEASHIAKNSNILGLAISK